MRLYLVKLITGDVHICIIGSTRCGKTRNLVIQSICLNALSGVDMLNTDPKGELFLYTNLFLKELGYKVITIDFKNPEKSDKFNFLQPVIDEIEKGNIPKAVKYAWDISDSLVKETNSDPIWSNGEKALITSAIMLVVYENSTQGLKRIYTNKKEQEIKELYINEHRKYQNMTNVYNLISKFDKKVNENITLLQEIMKTIEDKHPSKMALSMLENAPNETRGSFIASALSTLRLFTDQNIANITSETNKDIFDKDNKKAIFIILPDENKTYYPLASILTNQYYQFLVNVADNNGGRLERDFKFNLAIFIILPDENKTYYPLASILTNQYYQFLVNVADNNGGRLERDFKFNLDEFGNFTKIPDFDIKLTVGAGRGIHFNMYVQGIDQLINLYKREVTNIILGNCAYTIYLKSTNQETNENISKSLGKYTINSISESSSSSYSNYSSTSSSSSQNLIGRNLLNPDELTRIDRPYMLVIGDGRASMTKSGDLSQWHFNKVLGLGDKEHNKRVRNERDKMRKVYEIKDIQLWDIFSHFDKLKINQIDEIETEICDLDFEKIFNS